LAIFEDIRPNDGQQVLDSLAFIRFCERYSIFSKKRMKTLLEVKQVW